ncbi:sigma-54-dependent Fis family transcriptional regulator [Pandoraea capi]|uniref:Sigma-54-dependent Fis family transcriptional regulator n=1 Tax=Pandoraea capi TaxID=2508286 RepID=A0ABY6VRR2_9BURK|nr:sigma-54 dependent transcriptional regulator [Pandoraea capi]VVD80620.1 sigma-54-dependent Fis family transcriptional regulator [Pandoraea capi]
MSCESSAPFVTSGARAVANRSPILLVGIDRVTRDALSDLCLSLCPPTLPPPSWAGTLAEADAHLSHLSHLSLAPPSLVMTDVDMPDGSGGFDVLEGWAGRRDFDIVMCTARPGWESAVQALRRGARDYLVLPGDRERAGQWIARATEQAVASEGASARDIARAGEAAHAFSRMLGQSDAMQRVFESLSRVAPTHAAVLLTGESGTGKELAARAVHDLSERRDAPFLAVNCGAIAPNLVESEVFGHERGSFTGAERRHHGFFERAHGGTLFLDEIAEMPLQSQVNLLRVLETGTLTRLGGTQEIAVDVRIVAATNVSPGAAMRAGKLRSDLFHRLNVFPVTLPPLRERGDDVTLLAQAMLDAANALDGRAMRFAPHVLTSLRRHDWPGNVRELRNFVQRVRILSRTVTIDSLPPPISETLAQFPVRDDRTSIALDASLADLDRQVILGALAQSGGVKARAAEQLGISLKTLYAQLARMSETSG